MESSQRRHIVLQYWRAAAVGEGLATFGNPLDWEAILEVLLKAATGAIRPEEASKMLAERGNAASGADGGDSSSGSDTVVGRAVRFVQTVNERHLRDSTLLHLVAFLAFERSRLLIREVSVSPEWLEAADHVFLCLDSQGTGCCFADCLLLAFASAAPLHYLQESLEPLGSAESPSWVIGGHLTRAMGARSVVGGLSSMGAVSLDTWKRCLWSLAVPANALRQWRARLVRLYHSHGAAPWAAAVDSVVPKDDTQIAHALHTRGLAVWTELSCSRPVPPKATVVRSLVEALGTSSGNEWLDVETLRWWGLVEKVWDAFVRSSEERVRQALATRSEVESEGEEGPLAEVGATWRAWISPNVTKGGDDRHDSGGGEDGEDDAVEQPVVDDADARTVRVKLFAVSQSNPAPIQDDDSSSESDCVLDDSDPDSGDDSGGNTPGSPDAPSFRASVPVTTRANTPPASAETASSIAGLESIATRLATMRASLGVQTAGMNGSTGTKEADEARNSPQQSAPAPSASPVKKSAPSPPPSPLARATEGVQEEDEQEEDKEGDAWDADVAALRHALEFRRAMGPSHELSGTQDAYEFSYRSSYRAGHVPTFTAIAEGARELSAQAAAAGRPSHATMALRIAEWAALLAQAPGTARPAAAGGSADSAAMDDEDVERGGAPAREHGQDAAPRGGDDQPRPRSVEKTVAEFASPGDLSSPGWSPRPMRPVDAVRVPLPESRKRPMHMQRERSRSRTPSDTSSTARHRGVMETPAGHESAFDAESWPRSVRPSPMGLSALPTSPPVTPGLGQSRCFFPDRVTPVPPHHRSGPGPAGVANATPRSVSSQHPRKARHLRTVSRGRGQVLSPDAEKSPEGHVHQRGNSHDEAAVARELWHSCAGFPQQQVQPEKPHIENGPPVRAYKARLSHIPHQGTGAPPARATRRGWRTTKTNSSSHVAAPQRQKPPRDPRVDRREQRRRQGADSSHPLPGVVLESLSGTTTASLSHSTVASTQTETHDDPRRRRERGNPGAWDRPWRQRARSTS